MKIPPSLTGFATLEEHSIPSHRFRRPRSVQPVLIVTPVVQILVDRLRFVMAGRLAWKRLEVVVRHSMMMAHWLLSSSRRKRPRLCA